MGTYPPPGGCLFYTSILSIDFVPYTYISIFPDPIPSNDDFALSCTRDVNIVTGNSYDISIRLELNDQFTSAYRDAIAYFRVAIVPYNNLGPINPIGLSEDEARLMVNSTFLEAERTYINIPARENDEEYYEITVSI